MNTAHKVLVVEDDPIIAQAVANAVRALGHEPTIVTNTSDAERALAEHDYCYILPDVSLPRDSSSMALPQTGWTFISETVRRRFSHRNANGYYTLPVVVFSAHGEPRFVSRALELGGDAFIDKPSFDDITILTDKILERLRLAGREDHAACEAMRAPSEPPPSALRGDDPLKLRILGEMANGNVRVNVGDRVTWLTPALLRALLYLAVGRLRSQEGYVKRSEMGKDAGAVVRSLSRLRVALGVRIDEVDTSRGYRLAPNIEIEHVATTELARLKGEAVIAKLATEIERLQKARGTAA
jgi:CheY-like chemotaxis protein